MGIAGRHQGDATWRAAAFTGLVTSSFSTLAVCLVARRIGRPVALSWMEVATVALRGRAVRTRPGPCEVLAGVLVHQAADFAWAVTFYGLGARWSRRLHPAVVAAISPAWATATQAAEYHTILPWLQPLLRMQVPYWVGLGASVASGAAYPLYPWLRARVAGQEAAAVAFGRRWALLLGAVLGLLAAPEVLGRVGREPRWPGLSSPTRAYDRWFMRRMAAHHEVGVRLALLAADWDDREELRLLVRRRAPAAHAGGARNDAGHAIPRRSRSAGDTERRFVELITQHHEGAMVMADEARQCAGNPRLRLFAAQVTHAQRGQIARMEALGRAATERTDAIPAPDRRAPATPGV